MAYGYTTEVLSVSGEDVIPVAPITAGRVFIGVDVASAEETVVAYHFPDPEKPMVYQPTDKPLVIAKPVPWVYSVPPRVAPLDEPQCSVKDIPKPGDLYRHFNEIVRRIYRERRQAEAPPQPIPWGDKIITVKDESTGFVPLPKKAEPERKIPAFPWSAYKAMTR